MRLSNKITGRQLLAQCTYASGFFTRLIGFMGKTRIPGERGILFPSCRSIHTFFMQVPIDVIFLDGSYRVLEIHECVEPGLVLRARQRDAKHTLETSGGWAKDHGVETGDMFALAA